MSHNAADADPTILPRANRSTRKRSAGDRAHAEPLEARLLLAANDYLYAPSYKVPYTDTASLTAADWVGPDGIVYPKFDKAGVEGGIPNTSAWATVHVTAADNEDIADKLQQAISTAGETYPNGAIVRLPAGTFKLNKPITVIYDNVVIRGAGKGGTSTTRLQLSLPTTRTDHGSSATIGAPAIIPSTFKGKFTRYSNISVFFDPRYNGTNNPQGTVREVRLDLLDGGGNTIPNGTKTEIFGSISGTTFTASNPSPNISAGWYGEDFYGVRSYIGSTAKFRATVWYTNNTPDTADDFSRTTTADLPADYDAQNTFNNTKQRWFKKQTGGFFTFWGDQWTQRGTRTYLTASAARGSTTLTLDGDLATLAKGSLTAGSQISIAAPYGAGYKAIPSSNPVLPDRVQHLTIASISGRTVTVREPLRVAFPATTSSVRAMFPIQKVGVDNLILEHATDHWLNTFEYQGGVRNGWIDNVQVERPGRNPFWISDAKHFTVSNSTALWARWPEAGNASGYIGGGGDDLLFDNISAVGFRHAPNIVTGNGTVVRNSFFDLSDAQQHQGFARETLFENVYVRADGRGSYGNGFFTTQWEASINSGGTGDRTVLFNNDLYGSQNGVYFGGRQENMIVAYNRIRAEKESPIRVRGGSFDHIIYGNTLIGEDRFEPALTFGSADFYRDGTIASTATVSASNNPGVEFIKNKVYGTNGSLSGWVSGATDGSTLYRSYGNVTEDVDATAARPTIPSYFTNGSLLETQKANPTGKGPAGTPDYNPSPSFTGAANLFPAPRIEVAKVSFNPSARNAEIPTGWLTENNAAYGDRGGGNTYGWDATAGLSHPSHSSWEDANPLYLWNTDFGAGDARKWSILLPAGSYDVYLALGDPRKPHRAEGNPQVQYPLAPGAVGAPNLGIKVNNVVYNDVDFASSAHPAAYWISGVSNAGDRSDAVMLRGATVANETGGKGRLTIERTANTSGLKIMFLQIDKAAAAEPSPAPTGVSLAASSDTGASSSDRVTRVGDGLQFTVTGTVAGAAVSLYAGGNLIGSTTASGTSATLTTTVALADGLHAITARQTEAGRSLSGASPSLNVTVDTVGGRVTGLWVDSSLWTAAFRSALGSERGFAIPAGAGQLATLPWTNLDRIRIRFSEHVSIVEARLALAGTNVPTYATNGFSYDPVSYIATWTLSTALRADRLRITVADQVADTAGNALDGEWADGSASSSFTAGSGDGIAGGAFRFRLNVLPGDVDRSGAVLSSDVLTVRNRQGSGVGEVAYSIFCDVDGSGTILSSDVLLTRNRQGAFLPGDEPS